jgi:hypothetical protein
MNANFFKLIFSALLAFGLAGLGWCLISIVIFILAPLKPNTELYDVVFNIALMYFAVTLPFVTIVFILIYKNFNNLVSYEYEQNDSNESETE